MAKGKSKEFIARTYCWSSLVHLKWLNNVTIFSFCPRAFKKLYGISFDENGEKKRIRITIEEIT